MAQIETQLTNGVRVVTHIRGRVYASDGRPKQSLATRSLPQAKQRRRVCLLNSHDAYLLEHYGISQPCHGPECRHSHVTRRAIEEAMRKGHGAVRWVGRGQNVAAWRHAREWRPKMSAGVKVLQLVECGR